MKKEGRKEIYANNDNNNDRTVSCVSSAECATNFTVAITSRFLYTCIEVGGRGGGGGGWNDMVQD